MDYSGDLRGNMNKRTLEGADEQRSDLMTESLEKRDLSKIWEGHEAHLRVVLANSKSDCTRKYHMEKFQLDSKIGKFGKAVFYQANFEERQVILKAYSAEEPFNIPWKELDFLRYVKHPRVIEMYGAFRKGSSFLVLQSCYGNITHFAKEMSEVQQLRLCLQLMEGVDFLHQKSVIHACIAPETILISAHGNLVLSEFSQAIYLKENEQVYLSEVPLGIPAYQNLDALQRKRYSKQTDIHACACVMFELEFGTPLQRVPGAKDDDIKLYIEVLSIGYPVTNSDNSVTRKLLTEIINQSKFREILTDMIGAECSAGDFRNYMEVQKGIDRFMISLETLDEVIQPPILKSMWEKTPCGPIATSPHLDCFYWNFYYDDNDEPTVAEKEDDVPDVYCPPLDSLLYWQPFLMDPNLKEAWEEALERGESFAFEYWRTICREMYGINEDLLKGFDKWSAYHRKLYERSLVAAAENDRSRNVLDSQSNRECTSVSMEIRETSMHLRDSGNDSHQTNFSRPATPPYGKAGPAATVFMESTKPGPLQSKGPFQQPPAFIVPSESIFAVPAATSQRTGFGHPAEERCIIGNFQMPIRPKPMPSAWNNSKNTGIMQTPDTVRATTSRGTRAATPPPGSRGPAATIFTETQHLASTPVNDFKFPAAPKPQKRY